MGGCLRSESKKSPADETIRPFDRSFSPGGETFAYIGHGSIGGKAQGLVDIKDALTELNSRHAPDVSVYIPSLTVIATGYFDDFLKQNDLYEIAFSDLRDDQIARSFQRAELPPQLTGDLRALISRIHYPLAIRSSSLLEDAMFEPFAGVYATKMIPNNQHDPDIRFRKLVEAVKYVYASTFFADAKEYTAVAKHKMTDEKMAVIIQEVVGGEVNNRFYPQISGVLRSYNFYPAGHAKPEDGVVELALGLGRTIVDEGVAWSFSPAQPQANPPYNSLADLLKQSQNEFWAIHMGTPLPYDPIKETEHMLKHSISEAEEDGNLKLLASTYAPQDDRIRMGIGTPGPRIVDFASILKLNAIPLNDVLKDLLEVCEEKLDGMAEIEFAVTLDSERGLPAGLGFLQVRPMVVSQKKVDVSLAELSSENAVVASESVLGNGDIHTISDIVYIKPDSFEIAHTVRIAKELEQLNHQLVGAKHPYVLLGFGRWGTSDPQAGIPVNFGQISGAKVIVEATLPDMNMMLSQGSHFFHNITSFQVCYFSVACPGKYEIKWEWLDQQQVLKETEFCRHVRTDKPIHIKVDGLTGRGVICHERG
ncbi:PEP/pyruvate-binding domain-containing protein [Gemmatimonadota bacterium]